MVSFVPSDRQSYQTVKKEDILNHLDAPAELERMFRSDRKGFASAFQDWAETAPDHPAFPFWKARMDYAPKPSPVQREDWFWVIGAALLSGILVRIPEMFDVSPDFFYSRNLSIAILPMIMAYFLKPSFNNSRFWMIPALGVGLATLYINLLSESIHEDVLFLVCLHLPLFMWSLTGVSFLGEDWKNSKKRLDFLRFNGDLIIMSTLVSQAGGLLSLLTIGLFELINFSIAEWYTRNVMVMGAAAIPLLSTHWVRSNPKIVNRLSPLIARVFSPVVLLTLSIYLVAMIWSVYSLFEDRNTLLLFNVVLIGVLALILFSMVEVSQGQSATTQLWILISLSVVTIAINSLAISAIAYRIVEWGFTPNRLAVLGGNVLFLLHLILVCSALIRELRFRQQNDTIERALVWFLPIYAAWTLVVVVLFPILF